MEGSSPGGDELEQRVFDELQALQARAAADHDLIRRGRWLTVECLVGSVARPWHLSIASGHVVEARPGPVLMRPWTFAIRAEPAAWLEFWQPMPRPGFHDLLALTKRGVATVEGDLRPFLANLQYLKDLLALPRGAGATS